MKFQAAIIFFTFGFSHARKLKCDFVCPNLEIKLTNTFTDFALSVLRSHGPSDGVCVYGDKYRFKGSDFGFDYDVCCCLPAADAEVLDCINRGPGVVDCPIAPLSNSAAETYGEYVLRVGQDFVNTAPSNGCCPVGTIKWVAKPELTKQPKDLCLCVEQPRI